MRLDHLVLVAADLDAGSVWLARLGFTVTPGGTHAGGRTHNALIPLRDGSYLELLAPTDPGTAHPGPPDAPDPIGRRFAGHLRAGPGPADYALLSDDLDADLDAARRRGLPMTGPLSGGRERPDGRALSWRFGVPETLDVPFLIADETPRAWRVPAGRATYHANGAAGVAGLTVAVPDLDAAVARYRALLGAEPDDTGADHALLATTARFGLGRVALLLAAPAAPDSPLHDTLAARGAGPCHIRLSTVGGSERILCLGHDAQYRLTPCPPAP